MLFLGQITIAQVTDCADPLIFLSDDMESYSSGDVSGQAEHWTTWPGFVIGGIVSTDVAQAGDNSLKIDGSLGSQDVLLTLDDKTEGHFILRWDMYVSDSTLAYFNVQHDAPTETTGFWAFDAFFDGGGQGNLNLNDGAGDVPFTYSENEWFEVYVFADLDNDEARLVIGETTVAAWTFSNGVTGQGENFPLNQLNSVNFFPINEDYLYYIDNVDYWEIPAAGEEQYCYTATDIEPGMITVDPLTCFGAAYDLGGGPLGDETRGEKGAWFRFVPEEDGVIGIFSCLQGVDTRGWILEGECHSLSIVGVNDDQCELEAGGDEWASTREAVVTAGNTYYILWDDPWDAGGFSFDFTFTTEAPAEGDFCQSALAIDEGEHILDEFTGNAAVAGKNINTFTSSTTPYSRSEWYAYTATGDGTMTITSCEGAGSDTHVFVYTGDCSNFDGLTIVGQNDNGENCPDLQSELTIEIVQGETYYIEWIDRWDPSGFFWELQLELISNVTNAEALATGVKVYPNPASEVLRIDLDLMEEASNLTARLFNTSGQLLLEKQLGQVRRGATSLDVAQLPAGMYYLQLVDGTVDFTKTIVIE